MESPHALLEVSEPRKYPLRAGWNCRLDHVSRCDHAASPNCAEDTFKPWMDLACPYHAAFQAGPKAIDQDARRPQPGQFDHSGLPNLNNVPKHSRSRSSPAVVTFSPSWPGCRS
jgi:hypothetical protein